MHVLDRAVNLVKKKNRPLKDMLWVHISRGNFNVNKQHTFEKN